MTQIMEDISSNRGKIYSGFAQAFTFPEEEMEVMLMSGEVELALREVANELPFDCLLNTGDLNTNLKQSDYAAEVASADSLSILYSSKFEVGNPPVSFHESSYSMEDNKKILEDLFRFYEHFGLSFENQKLINTPDWLISELEFLHYLSFLESSVSEQVTKRSFQKAQLDFLERHLGQWCKKLSEKLNEQSIEIYGSLSCLLDDFIVSDQKYLASVLVAQEQAQEQAEQALNSSAHV